MTMATVRPIFQNGQRLTAERLTQGFEFLRTMLRRVLLAPLSSGVAAGFDFSPTGETVASELTISPGLAIDGKARLLVAPVEERFTDSEIAALAGIANPDAGTIVRVCIALDDSSAGLDPCSPHRPLDIEENYRVLFIEETLTEALFQILNQFQEPNCVPAWENLDLPALGGENDCCVTLGHVLYQSRTTFKATTFFRQGVSPRFNAIRNTNGEPSIFLNEFEGEPVVTVPVQTIFGPKRVVVSELIGNTVQATQVARFGGSPAAGQVSPASPAILELAGGAGETGPSALLPGLAGIGAVACELDTGNGDVTRAGLPLEMVPAVAGGVVQVRRVPAAPPTQEILLGLSAGPSYPLPTDPSKRVVPIATAGLVRVTVQTAAAAVQQGAELTAADSAPEELTLVSMSSERRLARAAQEAPMGPATTEIYAWVIHPAVLG